MPDYGEILAFLAANPPHLDVEKELHASLLELLAQYLRGDQSELDDDENHDDSDAMLEALGIGYGARRRLN